VSANDRPARIDLHIERLVLDDIRGNRAAIIRSAIETELARLLADGPPILRSSVAVPLLRGAPVTADAAAPSLGADIARSIHGAVTR
jgi:hypothetical protein